MPKTGWICAILPLLAFSMALGAQPPKDWTGLRRFFRQQVADAGIVGASLVIVREGKIEAEEYVGHQEEATRRPVDRDTIYHWASITKTFTGIAIMQLRDRGLLALDDPVVKYVPEVRQIHNPFGDVSQITIRRLMSHSAGLRASTWPWGGDRPWHPFEPTAWSQLAAMFPYSEVLFEPGTQYRYSNPGIILLGRIIETLSGDDYEMYVTKNILMPLEMHRAFFDRAPYHLRDRRSHSYARTDAGLEEMRFDFDTGITVSNGGLNAPLTDMARYLGFLIGDPARPEYEGVLRRSHSKKCGSRSSPPTTAKAGAAPTFMPPSPSSSNVTTASKSSDTAATRTGSSHTSICTGLRGRLTWSRSTPTRPRNRAPSPGSLATWTMRSGIALLEEIVGKR